jgi:molybdopterin converting factor small subunit
VTAPARIVQVPVRVPNTLRGLVAGERTVVVDVPVDVAVDVPVDVAVDVEHPGNDVPVTVAGVLDALAVRHAALERRIRDELGRTRIHVNLFVGPDNIRDLDGLATPVAPGQELSIIPAISGG